MKHLPILFALLLPTAAAAQQARDPAIDAYRQLLLEANDRLASVSARSATLEKQLAAATADLDKEKAAHAPAPAASGPDQKPAPASTPGN